MTTLTSKSNDYRRKRWDSNWPALISLLSSIVDSSCMCGVCLFNVDPTVCTNELHFPLRTRMFAVSATWNDLQAPKRFGRKLTAAQKELATHICADCGWIYTQRWLCILQIVFALRPLPFAARLCQMLGGKSHSPPGGPVECQPLLEATVLSTSYWAG